MKISKPAKVSLTTLIIIGALPYIYGQQGTVETITYHSGTQNTSCNMNIYLPAGYNELADTINSYPVFYLIHGGGENYTHWINYGYADHTLDDAIAAGEAVPMILVMPDGKNLDPKVFTDELLNDIIPYVESNYRVTADKDHRGVGGLSWGGLQAMEAGIYHYDMFGYLAVLSSGWFTTDQAAYNRAATFLEANSTGMEASINYFYFSEGTSSDIAYANGMATMGLFKDYGLTVHYWEHAGGHSWTAWKADFKAMVPYLFRDSSIVYVALDFQGGNIGKATIMGKRDSLFSPPATPYRRGHSFTGWFKQPEGIDSFNFAMDTVRHNMTLYADWTINTFKVSFNSNGGTEISDTIIALYNSLITAPADPERPDFVFDGWYTSEAFNQKWNFSLDRVTQDMTLVAKWNVFTAIKDNRQTGIIIYPNPAHSFLSLGNLSSGSMILISNTSGVPVLQQYISDQDGILAIGHLPVGVYIIRITNNEEDITGRLLIHR